MLRLTEALRRLAVIGILSIIPIAYSSDLRAQQSVDVRANESAASSPPKGPEAGVWVIAETTDLPTKFARIVVTDDQGRYTVPICRPPITKSGCAAMAWWNSPKMRAKPGMTLNHAAVMAPNEPAAAHYYPAIYWYAMMKIPPAQDFGGSTRHSQEDHAGQLAASR